MSLTKRNQEKRKDRKKLRKIKKQVQGITLIALVVTIIVLLILAGVAINLTVGDNGLFKRAQNAADTWQMAEQNEQLAMDEATDFLGWYSENTATTVKDAIQQNSPYKSDTIITDDLDNEITIPAGFKIALDSATKVEDGIVIEDKDGNQFVWIPVSTDEHPTIHTSLGEKTINYERRDFHVGSNFSDYMESLPVDEEASVNKNGGYYIGRFESGDKEATENKTMRSEEKDATITIRKRQVPYNYITQQNSNTKAEEMSRVQGYSTAMTKLVSSYAWDTAINFIEIKNEKYGSELLLGNYYNIALNYIDLNGIEQTKGADESYLIPTGQTTAVSNIYDMGGNLYEYTTEKSIKGTYPYVSRGGNFGMIDNYPAGYRGFNSGKSEKYHGFRVALYLKVIE